MKLSIKIHFSYRFEIKKHIAKFFKNQKPLKLNSYDYRLLVNVSGSKKTPPTYILTS
jgi:hypothetical protein